MTFCEHCGTDLDNPNHGHNCPRYDGAPPEPEGFAELRDKVEALCEAVAFLVENNTWSGGTREARDLVRRLRGS